PYTSADLLAVVLPHPPPARKPLFPLDSFRDALYPEIVYCAEGASAGTPIVKYSTLILGASYGSLFSTKLLLAGHRVALICTRPTAELINREGTLVRFPIKGRESLLDISSKQLSGVLTANTPEEVDPGNFDLVVLGMQEAQYGAPGVRELMGRVARARVPCLAIMNMPPLPYLKRIPGLETAA